MTRLSTNTNGNFGVELSVIHDGNTYVADYKYANGTSAGRDLTNSIEYGIPQGISPDIYYSVYSVFQRSKEITSKSVRAEMQLYFDAMRIMSKPLNTAVTDIAILKSPEYIDAINTLRATSQIGMSELAYNANSTVKKDILP